MELGFTEILMIMLIIVVLFGPDKIPQIARDLGTGVRKMRGAVEDIKTEIMKETDNPVSEIKREINKVKEAAKEYDPTQSIKKELESIEKSVEVNKPNQLDETYQGPVSR